MSLIRVIRRTAKRTGKMGYQVFNPTGNHSFGRLNVQSAKPQISPNALNTKVSERYGDMFKHGKGYIGTINKTHRYKLSYRKGTISKFPSWKTSLIRNDRANKWDKLNPIAGKRK